MSVILRQMQKKSKYWKSSMKLLTYLISGFGHTQKCTAPLMAQSALPPKPKRNLQQRCLDVPLSICVTHEDSLLQMKIEFCYFCGCKNGSKSLSILPKFNTASQWQFPPFGIAVIKPTKCSEHYRNVNWWLMEWQYCMWIANGYMSRGNSDWK